MGTNGCGCNCGGVAGESTCSCRHNNCGNWNGCNCGNMGTNGCGCNCGGVAGENTCSCNCGNWNGCGNGVNGCNCGVMGNADPCACACACAMAQAGHCGCHSHDCGDEEEEERTPCQSAVDAADDILGAINQINDAVAQLLKECCDVSDDEEDEGGDGCHHCGGHRRPRPGKACSLGGNSKNRLRELEQLLLSQLQTVQETETPAVVGEGGTPCAAGTADQSRSASATDLVFVG